MKLVSKEIYERFVTDLINDKGLDQKDNIESVEQIIDEDNVVRAQVVYFAGHDREPQYMIDKHIERAATLRAAQAELEERIAVINAAYPEGVSIDG